MIQEKDYFSQKIIYVCTYVCDVFEALTLCSSLHMSPPIERLSAVSPPLSLACSLAPAARRVVAIPTWL